MGWFDFTTGITTTGLTPKSLADGQLASTIGTLYTCPASTQTVISLITLVNTNSSAESVNIYRKVSGGSSRKITPSGFSLGIGYLTELGEGLMLEAGDIIEGDTATASKVDFTISGVENA